MTALLNHVADGGHWKTALSRCTRGHERVVALAEGRVHHRLRRHAKLLAGVRGQADDGAPVVLVALRAVADALAYRILSGKYCRRKLR
jgi:hypothetical protein